MAGGIMWLGGDLLFLAAIIALVYLWIRDDERRAVGEDRRLDAERAAIREREVILAARLSAEAGGGGASSPEASSRAPRLPAPAAAPVRSAGPANPCLCPR